MFSLPDLSWQDVIWVYDIYGMPVVYVRGKTTCQAIAHAVIDPEAIMKEKSQVLYANVMHVNSFKFLILVVEPL